MLDYICKENLLSDLVNKYKYLFCKKKKEGDFVYVFNFALIV